MVELAREDGPFLAAIAAVTEAQWAELWAALDALAGETVFAEWAGGQTVDGVTHVPYPEYTPAVERLRAAIGGAGLIVPYDWMQWDGIERYREPAALADASEADAVRLITAIVRSERFSDGSIEGALERGLLQAALERLR